MNLFIHLLIYFLLNSILLYVSLACNPRMWMHRMPPAVVSKAAPGTPSEKRLLYIFGIPFLLLLVIYPVIYLLHQPIGLLQYFLIACSFFVGFTLWDTLILDLLIFCVITPRFIIIPGTTREDYSDMKYHLISGAKGIVISLVSSGILSVIVFLLKS